MRLAAIDIGSNSIHVVIARAERGQHLEIIDREKEMVRLGSGTLQLHHLSKEATDRALGVLRRYKRVAEANLVDRILVTATAAVREAHNADEFVRRAREEVGLEVQVLPGVEEARLIALAVSEVTEFNGKRALIVDIGGGSTEFVVTGGVEPELLFSLRMGAVRLTEKFVSTDPILSDELERLGASVRSDLTRALWEISGVGYDFVVGSSGTVLNLVNAALQAESALDSDPPPILGSNHTVTLDQLRRLNRRLEQMTVSQRRRVPGLEKKRADIIVAGGLLLENIMLGVGAQSITTCDWSLREGVILNYLRESGFKLAAETDEELAAFASNGAVYDSGIGVRTRSVLSIARRYNYDSAHSMLVARLAFRIFNETRSLHGLGDEQGKLLEYAALLHDIGYHIAHNNHHRHSLYLIKNSEMPGFTGSEIAVIAGVARYHRGSMPTSARDARARREHEDFTSLDRSLRRIVLRLAAILRIADALDRTYAQLVADVECRMTGSEVVFRVKSQADCELELWAADRKAEWFRDLYQVSVRFEQNHEDDPRRHTKSHKENG